MNFRRSFGRVATQGSIALLAATTLIAITLPSPSRQTAPYWLWSLGYILTGAVITLRLTFVRDTPYDRAINRAAVAAGLVVMLCDPTVAAVISRLLPGGTPQLTDLWHAIFIYTCFIMIAIVLQLDRPEEDGSRGPQSSFYAIPTAIVAVLLVLSYPSVSNGREMYADPDWRFAAYFTIYALVPVALCLTGLWVYARLSKRTRSLRDRIGVGIIVAVGIIGCISVASIAFGAIMMARGTASERLESATIARVHGTFMLPFVLVVLVVLVPSIIDGARRRQRAQSAEYRLLLPMWEDCTNAIHDVVLTPDSHAVDIEERLHRMKVEIADALPELTSRIGQLHEPATVPGACADRHLFRYATELVLASRAIQAGEDPNVTDRVPPADLDPARIAEHWLEARAMADQIVLGRLGAGSLGDPAGRRWRPGRNAFRRALS